jgi:hypothetical protein
MRQIEQQRLVRAIRPTALQRVRPLPGRGMRCSGANDPIIAAPLPPLLVPPALGR